MKHVVRRALANGRKDPVLLALSVDRRLEGEVTPEPIDGLVEVGVEVVDTFLTPRPMYQFVSEQVDEKRC